MPLTRTRATYNFPRLLVTLTLNYHFRSEVEAITIANGGANAKAAVDHGGDSIRHSGFRSGVADAQGHHAEPVVRPNHNSEPTVHVGQPRHENDIPGYKHGSNHDGIRSSRGSRPKRTEPHFSEHRTKRRRHNLEQSEGGHTTDSRGEVEHHHSGDLPDFRRREDEQHHSRDQPKRRGHHRGSYHDENGHERHEHEEQDYKADHPGRHGHQSDSHHDEIKPLPRSQQTSSHNSQHGPKRHEHEDQHHKADQPSRHHLPHESNHAGPRSKGRKEKDDGFGRTEGQLPNMTVLRHSAADDGNAEAPEKTQNQGKKAAVVGGMRDIFHRILSSSASALLEVGTSEPTTDDSSSNSDGANSGDYGAQSGDDNAASAGESNAEDGRSQPPTVISDDPRQRDIRHGGWGQPLQGNIDRSGVIEAEPLGNEGADLTTVVQKGKLIRKETNIADVDQSSKFDDLGCTWAPWGDWAGCSASCGTGQFIRVRALIFGSDCQGTNIDTKSCSIAPCPCEYSQWSTWTSCSATCGGGSRMRFRFTTTGDCSNGGTQDDVQDTAVALMAAQSKSFLHEEDCAMVMCTGNADVDCEWGDWQNWSECSRTCGTGSRFGWRAVKRHPSDRGKDCSGFPARGEPCNTYPCPDERIDCQWSEWQDWNSCSKSCGAGEQLRRRMVKVFPQFGGATCEGDFEKTQWCNTRDCPPSAIDCRWGFWGSYSPCSITCGPGVKFRIRNIDQYPQNGGMDCNGPSQDQEECNKRPCYDPPPVNCLWSEWAPWSECNCGRREYTTRMRIIMTAGRHGGKDCEGPEKEAKSCDKQNCR